MYMELSLDSSQSHTCTWTLHGHYMDTTWTLHGPQTCTAIAGDMKMGHNDIIGHNSKYYWV